MNLIAIALISVYFLCYFPFSYIILRQLGVKNSLQIRAIKFGSTIALFQLFPIILFSLLESDAALVFGGIASVVLPFLYIGKILRVAWYKNVAIVILLPALATIFASFVYLIIFRSIG